MEKIKKLGKVRKIRDVAEKEPAKPNKYYKLGEGSKYIYDYNLRECIKLYLIQLGEYPTIDELEEMPVYKARKIMKKLYDLFEEKAEKRHMALTGKTYIQEANEKIGETIFGFLKKHD